MIAVDDATLNVRSRPHPRGGLRRAAPGRAPAPAHHRGRRAGKHPDLTDAAELAVQWRAAGKPTAAFTASLEAARAATGVYAYSEAVEHYTAAVALWSSADATGLDHAGDPARRRRRGPPGRRRRAADPMAGARTGGARENPDPLRAATFFERLGRFQDHHLDKSLTYYNEALLCLDETASAERARLLGDESLTLTLSVRWDEAATAPSARCSSRGSGQPRPRRGSRARSSGSCSPTSGSSKPAEAHLEEARRIGELLERPEDVSRAPTCTWARSGDCAATCPVRWRSWRRGSRRRAASASSLIRPLLRPQRRRGRVRAGPLGRGAGADQPARGASLTWSELLLRLTVSGQLAAGRGDFERARARLDEATGQLRESSATEWTAYVGACVIELLLTAGESEQALATATAELERVSGREEQLYTPALVGAAVRAAADVGALDDAERHTAWLSGFLNDASPPIARAHLAGAVAECDRARGASSAEQWDRVARGWDQLQHPYRAAYARVREAEALLAGPATARPPHGRCRRRSRSPTRSARPRSPRGPTAWSRANACAVPWCAGSNPPARRNG